MEVWLFRCDNSSTIMTPTYITFPRQLLFALQTNLHNSVTKGHLFDLQTAYEIETVIAKYNNLSVLSMPVSHKTSYRLKYFYITTYCKYDKTVTSCMTASFSSVDKMPQKPCYVTRNTLVTR